MHLILASGSIGRRELLQYIGIPFDVFKSTIDEYAIVGKTPYETLTFRARAKGENVVQKVTSKPSLVLAADTSVVFKGKLYGKPKDKNEAVEMFALFSGTTHEVVTAVHVIEFSKDRSQTILEESTTSRVTFKTLSPTDINRYFHVTDYTQFAGSYAINSGQDFIVKLEGSISNVVGLPLELLMPIFEEKELL